MKPQEAAREVLKDSQANTRGPLKSRAIVKHEGSWWMFSHCVGDRIQINSPLGRKTVFPSEVEVLE